MTNQQLLFDIQETIQTIPDRVSNDPQWVGRARSVLKAWDNIKGVINFPSISSLSSSVGPLRQTARTQVLALLHEAENDLKNREAAPSSVITPSGKAFDFYNEVRKIITEAKKEIFFIDPYLDPEFVERYLPHVDSKVSIRLLTGDAYLRQLLPSIKMFVQQAGNKVIVKKSKNFHDRFILIDELCCFQCGGSFKDGAVKAPASLVPLFDVFGSVKDVYEKIWIDAETQIF